MKGLLFEILRKLSSLHTSRDSFRASLTFLGKFPLLFLVGKDVDTPLKQQTKVLKNSHMNEFVTAAQAAEMTSIGRPVSMHSFRAESPASALHIH